MSIAETRESAIRRRNSGWANNPKIPGWVNLEEVDLDQFFTRDSVARYCHESLLRIISQDGREEEEFHFLEPSAGRGSFMKLLPEDRRTALDIYPQAEGIEVADFLTWTPPPVGNPVITIGNPPFGYRAWLALEFVNHAARFSEYVGMILPMSFQSEGKGSPRLRVRGLTLIHSEILPNDSFTDANGRVVKINALWQVWRRGENTLPESKTCDQWIDIFTVDQRQERLCGQERMSEADYFLQRTFYQAPPSLVGSFDQVKYVCGYGLVFKKDPERVKAILDSVDWNHYSNLAAHNCHHISMYHIRRALTDAGLVDD